MPVLQALYIILSPFTRVFIFVSERLSMGQIHLTDDRVIYRAINAPEFDSLLKLNSVDTNQLRVGTYYLMQFQVEGKWDRD